MGYNLMGAVGLLRITHVNARIFIDAHCLFCISGPYTAMTSIIYIWSSSNQQNGAGLERHKVSPTKWSGPEISIHTSSVAAQSPGSICGGECALHVGGSWCFGAHGLHAFQLEWHCTHMVFFLSCYTRSFSYPEES